MVQYPVGNVAFYYYTVSELHRDSSKGLFSRPEPPNKFEKIRSNKFFYQKERELCRRTTSQYSLQQAQSPIGLDRATSIGDLSRPSTALLKRPYKNTHLINGFYQVLARCTRAEDLRISVLLEFSGIKSHKRGFRVCNMHYLKHLMKNYSFSYH